MKKFVILFFIILPFIRCGGKSSNSAIVDIVATNTAETAMPDEIDGAYFRLVNNHFDFGEVMREKSLDIPIEVEFSNPGKKPLLILEAVVSCGCLSVDFPKNLIYPGREEKLTINIDMRGQEGIFNKNVYFRTNEGNEVKVVQIIGYVKK